MPLSVAARPHGLEVQGTNVRYRNSMIPTLAVKRSDASPFVLVALVGGHGGGKRPERLRGMVGAVSSETARVTIAFEGGETAIADENGSVSWSSNRD